MTTITLAKPIIGPSGDIAEIKLREPKFGDIMALGEPISEAMSAERIYFRSVNYEAIQGYARRLVIEPKDPLLLEQLNVADTRKLMRAIQDFFSEAPVSEAGQTN